MIHWVFSENVFNFCYFFHFSTKSWKDSKKVKHFIIFIACCRFPNNYSYLAIHLLFQISGRKKIAFAEFSVIHWVSKIAIHGQLRWLCLNRSPNHWKPVTGNSHLVLLSISCCQAQFLLQVKLNWVSLKFDFTTHPQPTPTIGKSKNSSWNLPHLVGEW